MILKEPCTPQRPLMMSMMILQILRLYYAWFPLYPLFTLFAPTLSRPFRTPIPSPPFPLLNCSLLLTLSHFSVFAEKKFTQVSTCNQPVGLPTSGPFFLATLAFPPLSTHCHLHRSSYLTPRPQPCPGPDLLKIRTERLYILRSRPLPQLRIARDPR